MNAPVNLQLARQRAEKQLERLRIARGTSILDGTDFDNSQITQAEADLAAIGEAEAEAERRAAAYRPTRLRQGYLKILDEFKGAQQTLRLDAVDQAEAAARKMAVALRAVFAATVNCLIPDFDGAFFSLEWKDALWVRFFTAAPRRQRRSVERYSIVKRA